MEGCATECGDTCGRSILDVLIVFIRGRKDDIALVVLKEQNRIFACRPCNLKLKKKPNKLHILLKSAMRGVADKVTIPLFDLTLLLAVRADRVRNPMGLDPGLFQQRH